MVQGQCILREGAVRSSSSTTVFVILPWYFWSLALAALIVHHGRMKVAVLLSGGVDSSVALWQLKKSGIKNITAYYLKIWLEDELSYLGECPWEEDLAYARAVCRQANVPLEVVPLQTEYFSKVVEYALAELRMGRTPSPDIFCNERIKFGAFLDKIDGEPDLIVSGHYASISPDPLESRLPGAGGGPFRLFQATDPVKDQSYFLSHLSQDQLAKLYFPLGNMKKAQVRALAASLDLPNKDRKDSQGICFLGKIRYPDFVRHYLGEQEGEIRDLDSDKVLGSHKGFWFHTIGQRSGLGLGNGPWYVVRKDTARNIIYVSHQDLMSEHRRRDFLIGELSWLHEPPDFALQKDFKVKLRHGPETLDAKILDEGGALRVLLAEPDQGVAPGQFTVIYRKGECLGSGKIMDFWGNGAA